MNTQIEVAPIKNIEQLPPTPKGHRLRFRQGVKSLDAARGVCRQERTASAWLFSRRERLYWFEPLPQKA